MADFENLPGEAFEGHDVTFCALGSTRAQAGSAVRGVLSHSDDTSVINYYHNNNIFNTQAAFRHIDLDYTTSVAQLSKNAGVSVSKSRCSADLTVLCLQQFSLVSSVGANPTSMFLYMEVKGLVSVISIVDGSCMPL